LPKEESINKMTLLKEKKIDQHTANAAWLAKFMSMHLRQIIIKPNHAITFMSLQ
jgi:hypothetical protein